jgi:hypothetical protein
MKIRMAELVIAAELAALNSASKSIEPAAQDEVLRKDQIDV